MNNLADRVSQRMRELYLTQEALAKLCGVKQSSIWSLLQGKIQKPRFLYQLADALQTSARWLTTGEGLAGSRQTFAEQGPQSPRLSEPVYPKASFEYPTIPILGKAHISKYGLALYIDIDAGQEIGRAPRHPAQEGVATAFAVYAQGDSMFPRYEQGELVYIAGFTPPMKGQDCLVELNNGEAYLKKFLSRNDKEVVCYQFNPPKECTYPAQEVSQIHAVAGRK